MLHAARHTVGAGQSRIGIAVPSRKASHACMFTTSTEAAAAEARHQSFSSCHSHLWSFTTETHTGNVHPRTEASPSRTTTALPAWPGGQHLLQCRCTHACHHHHAGVSCCALCAGVSCCGGVPPSQSRSAVTAYQHIRPSHDSFLPVAVVIRDRSQHSMPPPACVPVSCNLCLHA